MRKFLLPLIAAGSIVSAATPASAMTVGTASGLQAALAATGVLDGAAYVCRHRTFTSRRVCSFRAKGLRWRWNRRRS